MDSVDWCAAEALLQSGIVDLELAIAEQQQALMIDYIKMLAKWNKAYNLTSISDWRGMVIKHLLDSLAVNPWVSAKRLLDVGTGAGIPGIPLAIVNPDKAFTLLDSNGKKTRFIKQAITELGIGNVDVIQSRIEEYHTDNGFGQIVCRAYSPLNKFVEQVNHLLHSNIELLAMKGQLPEEECRQLPDTIIVKGICPLQVPYLDEQRHLVRLATQPL